MSGTGVHEDKVDQRSARDRAGSFVIYRQRGRARVERVTEQARPPRPRRKVSTANVVSPLPYTPICGTGDGCRENPGASLTGSTSSSRFFSTPAKSPGVVFGEPGAGPALRGQHAGVGCPRACLEGTGFPVLVGRAAVEDLHEQRQLGCR